MRLWSDSGVNGERTPACFAAQPTADGETAFADNLTPHLARSPTADGKPGPAVEMAGARRARRGSNAVDALGIARVPVEGRFSGAQMREAICPHILAEATHSGTCTLNRRLL
ncbi:MAG: hypothetical protein H7337_04085 [Rhizobacter sp.]|nr:hypothetical protein [Rhizobacter sp.]